MRGWCDLWWSFFRFCRSFSVLSSVLERVFLHNMTIAQPLPYDQKKVLVTDHDFSSRSSGHLLIRCAIRCAYSAGNKANGKSVCASRRPVCSRESNCSTSQCQECLRCRKIDVSVPAAHVAGVLQRSKASMNFTGDTVCYTENKFLSSTCDQKIVVAFLQVTLEPKSLCK